MRTSLTLYGTFQWSHREDGEEDTQGSSSEEGHRLGVHQPSVPDQGGGPSLAALFRGPAQPQMFVLISFILFLC